MVDISGWVADAIMAKWDKEEGGVILKGMPGMVVSELGGYLWEDASKVLHHDG